MTTKRTFGLKAATIVAVIFGVLTIVSGGRVLFSSTARLAAGSYVDFVLWFNFIAGFAYVVAGLGLWQGRRWAVWLAGVIAAATLAVFAALGWHIAGGGSFEVRTVGAMVLRSLVWLIIAVTAYRQLRR